MHVFPVKKYTARFDRIWKSTGVGVHVKYLITCYRLHKVKSAGAPSRKGSCSTFLPCSQPSLTRIHFSHYRQAAGWHISKKKRMGGNVWPFSVHSLESDMWFKCVREREKKMRRDGMQKRGKRANESRRERYEDRRSISYKGYLALLASRNSNPQRISSLIKQRVNQCWKDYYECHYTSQMPAVGW